jgi:hypothetical protein
MTYDETIDVLKGLPDRMVEAWVAIDGAVISGFSGIVGNLTDFGSSGQRWGINWRPDGIPKPHHGAIDLRRDHFVDAQLGYFGTGDPHVDLAEAVARDEEGDQSGTCWDIEISLTRGVRILLTVYL